MSNARIALVGDFSPAVVAHRAIEASFDLARKAGTLPIEPSWTATDSLMPGDEKPLSQFQGIWCVPASPYRSTEGALWAIQYARVHRIPFLGTCGGYQHALLEYARNVLGLSQAEHAELNVQALLPLVSKMSCSLVEVAQKVIVTGPGKFRDLYGANSGDEGYHCSYGLNPELEHLFQGSDMEIVARSENGEARAFALKAHPFFIGAQFQPERSALSSALHPLVRAFFAVCVQQSENTRKEPCS